MDIPQDLRYTADHEWARLEDAKVRVGLTDFAQEALGDIVFVQLPSVGDNVVRGGSSARSNRPSRSRRYTRPSAGPWSR